MTLYIQHPAIRKFITRFKRWYLGSKYRHMAKISTNLQIDLITNRLFWKNGLICDLQPIATLLNNFPNKTAYIIASGPSIKNLDIHQLHDKYTFGINGSILKFVEAGIEPTFYVISDEEFIYNRPQLLQTILSNKECLCFFTPQAISAICEINPELLKDHPKISLFHNHFKEYGKPALEYPDIVQLAQNDTDIITREGRIGFCLNPAKGVFSAHTVAYFALQIAYGLGFRIVNLLGMDLGSAGGETRFYEQGQNAMPSHLDRDYLNAILPSFEIVGEFCRSHPFQVFNLSEHSRLPDGVIPKKSFYEALQQL